MKQIVCPECGSETLRHYEDVYLVWTPVLDDDGTLGRLNAGTEEYDEYFECRNCGHKPSEEELLTWAARPVSNQVRPILNS
jgi:rubredoxin